MVQTRGAILAVSGLDNGHPTIEDNITNLQHQQEDVDPLEEIKILGPNLFLTNILEGLRARKFQTP